LANEGYSEVKMDLKLQSTVSENEVNLCVNETIIRMQLNAQCNEI
jgi:hypothetical protein